MSQRTKRSRTQHDAAQAQPDLPGREQLLFTRPEMQTRLGQKYCDEAQLLPLLLAHGLVRRVRTIAVEVRPLGGDSFQVRLDVAAPTVGEAKAEIARVQGTKAECLFKKLLENSYATKIENYKDETINYVGEKIKGNYAMVRTQIVRKDGVVDVDYKMLKDGDQWLVYDFVIEGVSLIRNYKSQFSKIISTESYAALVSKLSKKVDELEAKSNADADNL